jgi:hypothetical protein
LAKDITKYSKLGYEVVEEEGRYFAKKGDEVFEIGGIIKKKADDLLEETWHLSNQKLGRAADSRVLSDNLEAVGKVRPENSAAHHIVAGKHSGADEARRLLKEEDIDINEAANGVFLPMNSKYVIGETTSHANVHTFKYFQEINRRLEQTPVGQRRNALGKIAEELQKGIFPY